MKHIYKFASILLIISLLTSCTNRRYSHLTGFKFQSKSVAKQEIKHREEVQTEPHTLVGINDVQLSALIEQDAPVATDIDLSQNLVPHNLSLTTRIGQQAPDRLLAPIKTIKTLNGIKKQFRQNSKDNPTKITAGPQNKSDVSNLVYWILVVILVLLILTLLKEILGGLYPIFITVVLIILIGHLLGLW